MACRCGPKDNPGNPSAGFSFADAGFSLSTDVSPAVRKAFADETLGTTGLDAGHLVNCLGPCLDVETAFNRATNAIDRSARDKRDAETMRPRRIPWNMLSIKVQLVEAGRIGVEAAKVAIEGIFSVIKPATFAGKIAAKAVKSTLKGLIDEDLEKGLEGFKKDVAKEIIGEWIGEFLPDDTADAIGNLAAKKAKDLGRKVTGKIADAIADAQKKGRVAFTISRRNNFAALTTRTDPANVPGLARAKCCYRTFMVWNYEFKRGEDTIFEDCSVEALYCIDPDKKPQIVIDPPGVALRDLRCDEVVKGG